MTPVSFQERLARLDEWKQIHVEDFEDLQKEVDRLRIDILRNPMVTEIRVGEIEDRISKLELWKENMMGRFWMLGVSIGAGSSLLTVVIMHLWK